MSKLSQPEGWLTQKSGSWIANVNVVTINAETGEKSRRHVSKVVGRISDTTKAQARMLRDKFVIDTVGRLNGIRPDADITLSDFVKYVYIPEKSARWDVATDETTNYAIDHYIVSKLGNIRLGDFSATQLQLFLNDFKDMGFAASTVSHIRANLKAIFRLAFKRKYIAEDTSADIYCPKIAKRPKPVLDRDQLNALFRAISDPMDRCLIALETCGGLRSSELFGLVWRAINMKTKTLRVCSIAYKRVLYMNHAKTDESQSEIPIPDKVWTYLDAWAKLCQDTSADALVFPSVLKRGKRKGEVVPWDSYKYMKERIKPIALELGLSSHDICCQVFRRSMCTDLQNYGSLKDVQMLARHASENTTLGIYIQPISDNIRDVSNARSSEILAPLKSGAADAMKSPLRNTRQGQSEDLSKEEDEYDIWI